MSVYCLHFLSSNLIPQLYHLFQYILLQNWRNEIVQWNDNIKMDLALELIFFKMSFDCVQPWGQNTASNKRNWNRLKYVIGLATSKCISNWYCSLDSGHVIPIKIKLIHLIEYIFNKLLFRSNQRWFAATYFNIECFDKAQWY